MQLIARLESTRKLRYWQIGRPIFYVPRDQPLIQLVQSIPGANNATKQWKLLQSEYLKDTITQFLLLLIFLPDPYHGIGVRRKTIQPLSEAGQHSKI